MKPPEEPEDSATDKGYVTEPISVNPPQARRINPENPPPETLAPFPDDKQQAEDSEGDDNPDLTDPPVLNPDDSERGSNQRNY